MSTSENSIYNGKPVELYKFSYNGLSYLYTSSDKNITISGETYYPEFIMRSTLKPCSSSSDNNTLTISVKRTNSIAMLWQGNPPESIVEIIIKRVHLNNLNEVEILYNGRISQCSFKDSQAELIATTESFLNKELPKGKLSYYCQNVIYDNKCKLNEEQFKVPFVGEMNRLEIKSATFANYPDDYFTDGKCVFQSSIRLITYHKGNTIKIKYPIYRQEASGATYVVAGCNQLYTTCHRKFQNTANFSGVPMTPPVSADNPKGVGVYWVDSSVITRDSKGEVGTISL